VRRSPAAVPPSFSLEGDLAAVDQQIIAVTMAGESTDMRAMAMLRSRKQALHALNPARFLKEFGRLV
jgi:hypothetical protein